MDSELYPALMICAVVGGAALLIFSLRWLFGLGNSAEDQKKEDDYWEKVRRAKLRRSVYAAVLSSDTNALPEDIERVVNLHVDFLMGTKPLKGNAKELDE